MSKYLSPRAICAGLITMGLCATAWAAQPVNAGLGQAWPNAQDVSSSTHWHVYAFQKKGVEFIQVNDLNGNVRGAFATANGQFFVLPMGRDAARISTPQEPAALPGTAVPLVAYAEVVYSGHGVRLTAIPASDGTVIFKATASSSSVVACDPDKEDCNTHRNTSAMSAFAAPSCDPDKEDCNTHLSATTSALLAPSCDPDKEDCNTHVSSLTSSTLAAPTCDPDKEDCNTHLR